MNEARGQVRRPQLTDRDKQLFAYLAICRYLSTEQVLTLLFPARDRASSQRRLLRLAGEWGRKRGERNGAYANFDPPYLRRLFFRTYEGDRVEVWALTEVGYAVAAKVLGTQIKIPAADVGASFLEHSILLNDVLVTAVDPAAAPCAKCGGELQWRSARPDAHGGAFFLACRVANCDGRGRGQLPSPAELPFRWTGPEGARLPWKDYDRRQGVTRDRVIVPDAVLELPSRRARYFLEFETGTQSVVAPVDRKPGATIAKLERYADFLVGFADAAKGMTNYASVYPDNWAPTVLFVVLSDARRTSVEEAIGLTQKTFGRLSAKVMLPADVARMIRDVGPAPLPPVPARREEEPERLRPGRLSVRAQFLLDVAVCLREVAQAPAATERTRAVLRVAELYAERAAAAAGTDR